MTFIEFFDRARGVKHYGDNPYVWLIVRFAQIKVDEATFNANPRYFEGLLT